MTMLYLVRHGESAYNLEGRVQGQLDPPLTETGLRQAAALAERLAPQKFDAVYSSDLARASKTARIISKQQGLDVITTPLLRESRLGVVEGLTQEEIERRYPTRDHPWRQDPFNHRPPGAESISEVICRARDFLRLIHEKHERCERILAVGHIGSIRAIITAALHLPEHVYRALHVSNASISALRLENPPVLTLLNDTCHLDGTSVNSEEL
ncbi:MAG: histidine phosphatase family protein [Armatimonadota bacterium]|nr:histidine phosphatase family protein [Armatimonadota bacterium]